MLGRKIKNPVVRKAKEHIRANTNRDGFIRIEKAQEIRNYECRQRALLELGYVVSLSSTNRLNGYRKL